MLCSRVPSNTPSMVSAGSHDKAYRRWPRCQWSRLHKDVWRRTDQKNIAACLPPKVHPAPKGASIVTRKRLSQGASLPSLNRKRFDTASRTASRERSFMAFTKAKKPSLRETRESPYGKRIRRDPLFRGLDDVTTRLSDQVQRQCHRAHGRPKATMGDG